MIAKVQAHVYAIAHGEAIVKGTIECLAKAKVLIRAFVSFGIGKDVQRGTESADTYRAVHFTKVKLCFFVVVVIQVAKVPADIAGVEGEARIDVMLIRVHIAGAVVDVRCPGARIETAFMAVVDATLNRSFVFCLCKTSPNVVAGHRCIGTPFPRLRGCC